MNTTKSHVDYSVIIVHYQREENLKYTLEGLGYQNALPCEVIVVNFGKLPELTQEYPFPLRVLPYGKEWNFLPVAGARNLGARYAKSETLVFLDVDCIPSRHFCSTISNQAKLTKALVMGSPRYMLVKRNGEQDYNNLKQLSIPHPARPVVDLLRIEHCYELFWSLCFSVKKDVFECLGGFDEKYEGYAVEDTDFALTAKSKKLPFFLSPSEVFHQQHILCIPPINHLESIVSNCNHFYFKWGYWPLRDCLMDFNEMGFIEWTRKRRESIEILRRPTEKQIRLHHVENAPYR